MKLALARIEAAILSGASPFYGLHPEARAHLLDWYKASPMSEAKAATPMSREAIFKQEPNELEGLIELLPIVGAEASRVGMRRLREMKEAGARTATPGLLTEADLGAGELLLTAVSAQRGEDGILFPTRAC